MTTINRTRMRLAAIRIVGIGPRLFRFPSESAVKAFAESRIAPATGKWEPSAEAKTPSAWAKSMEMRKEYKALKQRMNTIELAAKAELEGLGARLQSSPAAVGGGVTELKERDFDALAGEAINGDEDSSDAEQSFRDGVRRGYAIAALRLRPVGEGEVMVSRNLLDTALRALQCSKAYVGDGIDHTLLRETALSMLANALRLTTEGENP